MNRFLIVLIFLSALSFCGEVLEEDISSQEVILRAPGDSAFIISDTISFWWDDIAGASSYEFHLVSPDFENVTKVLADTIISENLINLTLSPGKYSWEVRAINSGYQTKLFQRSFIVDTAQFFDISQFSLKVISPGHGDSVIAKEVFFWWDALASASSYQLRIVTPYFTNPVELVTDTTLVKNQFQVSLLPNHYEWEVRALSGPYSSIWTRSSFNLDSIEVEDISSETPLLYSPKDQSLWINEPVRINWQTIKGVEKYRIRIVKPNFSNPDYFLLDTLVTGTNLFKSLPFGMYEMSIQGVNSGYQSEIVYRKFETDDAVNISDEQVNINYPSNGDSLINSLQLEWSEVASADQYAVEIVTPGYGSSYRIMYQEDVSDTQLTLSLGRGKYEAKIIPQNAKYNGLAQVISFFIDQSVNIEHESIILRSPADSLRIKSQTVTFWWDKIENATTYELIIVSPGFENVEKLKLQIQTSSNQYQYLLDSGTYQWSVQAINQNYRSIKSYHTLFVDK